jgi:hypothetical protein
MKKLTTLMMMLLFSLSTFSQATILEHCDDVSCFSLSQSSVDTNLITLDMISNTSNGESIGDSFLITLSKNDMTKLIRHLYNPDEFSSNLFRWLVGTPLVFDLLDNAFTVVNSMVILLREESYLCIEFTRSDIILLVNALGLKAD